MSAAPSRQPARSSAWLERRRTVDDRRGSPGSLAGRGEESRCPTCGIHPYAEGTDPKGNRMAAINVRCLEKVDLAAIPVRHFDGRAM